MVLAVAIVCVALGVVLRFVNLDARSYSNDEATTSIRVAGSSLAEWTSMRDGRIRTVDQLRPFQTLIAGRTAADTVRALAVEDPQHPPLYYLLDRAWTQLAGTSVAQHRAVSAVFGVLAIGAAFLLGMELGGTLLAGWILAALVAVSPFHLVYAQQAREYALWAFLVLLSTWLLLRALRLGTWRRWAWYALAVAVGLYTDLLFLITVLAQAAVVAAIGRPVRGALLAWGAATAGAVVAFAPWLVAVYHGRHLLTNNNYLGAKLPASVFLAKWVFNASTTFVDLQYRHPVALLLLPVLAIVVVALAIVALRRGEPRALVAAVALVVVTAVAMTALDLVRHESRSTAARYLIPTWIGVELLVATGIAALVRSGVPAARVRGALAFAFLVALGGWSAIAETRADWSWADSSAAPLRPVAAAINATPNALLIFKDDPTRWDFTAAQLVNMLRGDVQVRFETSHMPLLLGSPDDATLLLDPSASTRDEARKAGRSLQLLYAEGDDTTGLTRVFRAQAHAVRREQRISDERISLWRVGG